MKKRRIVLAALFSAAVLALTGCGESAADSAAAEESESAAASESESADDAESSESSEAPEKEVRTEKPEILKEGILTHLKTVYPDGSVLREETYDENGKILRMTDNTFAFEKDITYEYDEAGNLVRETKDWNDDGYLRDVTEYDGNGNIIRKTQTIPENDHVEYDHSYTYEFDEAGNPVVCNDENNHKVWERQYTNGVISKQLDYAIDTMIGYYVSYDTDYDADGKMIKRVKYNKDGAVLHSYEYDSFGNVTAECTYNKDDPTIVEESRNYEYDSNGSMIKADVVYADMEKHITFENDYEGNMIKQIDPYPDGSGADEYNYSYEYEYDEFGNKVKQEYYSSGTLSTTTTYEYAYKD